MRCKSCDYPLWQIRARKCPECGAPFLPSEFDYILNSVRFCCPNCGQAYYGTGERGHLVPRSFNCVSCSQPVDMDEMVLLPAEGVREEQTKPEAMPWLDRGKGAGSPGFTRAWFATVGKSMVAPGRLMKLVPPDSSLAAAFGFFTLTNVVVILVATFPILLIIGLGAVAPAVRRGGGAGALAAVGTALGVIAGTIVGGLIFTLVLTMIWVVSTHGLLRIGAKPEFGLRRTTQAIFYSSGANVTSAVPCVGYYFGWIWWLVSAVFTIKEGQRVSGGRAAFATLTPPLVMLALFIASYFGFVFWAMGIATAAAARAQSSQTTFSQTGVLAAAIKGYAEAHGGNLPAHAVDLVFSHGTYGLVFVLAPEDGPTYSVGGRSLDTLDTVAKAQEQSILAAAINALPPNVVAHRVGDFVFTYHGMNLQTADPGLWTVICWPGQASGLPASTRQLVQVGVADGSVTAIHVSTFATSLADQNLLRSQAGLPPLPHPSAVTHVQPGSSAPAPDDGSD